MRHLEIYRNSQNFFIAKVFVNGEWRILRDEDTMSIVSGTHVSKEAVFSTYNKAYQAGIKFLGRFDRSASELPTITIINDFEKV